MHSRAPWSLHRASASSHVALSRQPPIPLDELPHAPNRLSYGQPSSEQRSVDRRCHGVGGGSGGGEGGGEGGGGEAATWDSVVMVAGSCSQADAGEGGGKTWQASDKEAMPNWACWPSPQHMSVSVGVESKAHVWSAPVATYWTLVETAVTAVGDVLSAVSPSSMPSWPYMFSPQHQSEPSESFTQV